MRGRGGATMRRVQRAEGVSRPRCVGSARGALSGRAQSVLSSARIRSLSTHLGARSLCEHDTLRVRVARTAHMRVDHIVLVLLVGLVLEGVLGISVGVVDVGIALADQRVVFWFELCALHELDVESPLHDLLLILCALDRLDDRRDRLVRGQVGGATDVHVHVQRLDCDAPEPPLLIATGLQRQEVGALALVCLRRAEGEVMLISWRLCREIVLATVVEGPCAWSTTRATRTRLRGTCAL